MNVDPELLIRRSIARFNDSLRRMNTVSLLNVSSLVQCNFCGHLTGVINCGTRVYLAIDQDSLTANQKRLAD